MRWTLLAVGLISIACGGESASPAQPEQCGWRLALTYSVPAACWNARSLDIDHVRIQNQDREFDCWGEINGCNFFACETITGLGPRDVLLFWAAPGLTYDDAVARVETTLCD